MPLLYSRLFSMTSNRRRRASRRSTQNNSPRQLPSTTSTTSINWWPYPPWGATTTSTSTQIPAIAIITTTISPNQPETPTPAIPEVLSSSLITPSYTSVISSDSNTPSSTTSSSSASFSITTITGTRDPQSSVPSETVAEYPKIHPASSNQNINLILIPVFVVLGVVVGSIVAWFSYGCITRKPGRRRQRSELEAGPAYCPPSLSSKGRGSVQEEKISFIAEGQDNVSDDGHSWHALDMNDEQRIKSNERDAFLGRPQPVASKYLAPVLSTRKPPSTRTDGLERAKSGASTSVYSQLGDNDDDEYDEASFVGEHGFDSKLPCIPASQPFSKKKQTLHSNSLRRAPTAATTTTMASSDTRTLSLSRRRPTCPRTDTSSSKGDREDGKDQSRANTIKTTKTTATDTTPCRSGANTTMSFRIMDGSPLSTPLHSPPVIDASGFSWAGVGEMLWRNGSVDSPDRFTNLPERNGRSPAMKKSTGSSGDGASSRSGRTRSRSVAANGKRSKPSTRADSSGREEDKEKKLRDYYGYGDLPNRSPPKLPRSPSRVTSPRLEGELCFTPVIEQGN
ncbi:hypothetical protein L218DRAFT_1072246 [Marasmius fiardii PR-910]|nr:hypothetical protein L218DRAFT_1072246 [Marasmius fiardii PR-910]